MLNHEIIETDKAYIAGLFDGEGSVSILSTMQKNLKEFKRGRKLTLLAYVTNTNEDILNWLNKIFGGNKKFKASGLGKKPCFRWQVGTRTAKEFLEIIYPYLKIKKRQAEIGIEFQSLKRIRAYNKYPITDKEWSNQMKLRKELLILNGRGDLI